MRINPNIKIINSQNPLTEEDLLKFEETHNIKIPTDYRNFLLLHNGGRPDPKGFLIDHIEQNSIHSFLAIKSTSTGSNLAFCLEVFKYRIPEDLFPIAHDHFGNVLCLSKKSNQILFWDHELETEDLTDRSNISFVANSLEELINSLQEF